MSDAVDPAQTEPERPPRRPRRLPGGVWLVAAASVAAIIFLVVLAGRYGGYTPFGRAFIESRLEGLELGGFGRLHIEGLKGDIWGDFTVERATVTDSAGVWVEARRIHVHWAPSQLLRRRVLVRAATADSLRLIRRPVVRATQPGPMPVSVIISDLRLKAESAPAFSVVRGLFTVAGSIDIERKGGLAGSVDARSLLHPGDGLLARFNIGLHNSLFVDAKAVEGPKGALAGALGLPVDRPFSFYAVAGGGPNGGRLFLRALTGAQVAAQAVGGWSHDGGAAQGRVSLAASSLTSKLLRQLGPEARLSAKGRKAGENLFDIDFRADADNLSLSAAGAADIEKQTTPRGLRVAVVAGDLSRLLSQPGLGRGSISGVLNGPFDRWRLAGQATVEKLAYAGYALERVQGPFDLGLYGRELRLQVTANGVGGSGKGLLAALAGARPQAVLQGSRLADGRLLVRSLNATGAGLKIQASGVRGLLGDLSFKGGAELSNLAAAHRGAKGVVNASWTAAQARADRPWSLTLNAHGAGLTTGLGELDRLLGQKPGLTAQASFAKGSLAVAKADLSGAAAHLTTAGLIGLGDGSLKLALNWTAVGPFVVGPLEIAGKAKGNGALTGTIAQPHADLLADFDRIDLPDLTLQQAHVILSLAKGAGDIDGHIAITAGSDYGPAHAKSAFNFANDGVVLTGLDAAAGGATAAGSISLRQGAPSTADLLVTAGPGAFATQGHAQAKLKITDQPGGATAVLALTADSFTPRGSTMTLKSVRLNAQGPLAHLPYTVSGEIAGQTWPARLTGSGVMAQQGKRYLVSFTGSGKLRKADFHTLTPASLGFGEGQSTVRASLALGDGRIDVDGSIAGGSANGKAGLSNLDLAILDEDLAGRVSGDLAMNGHGPALSGGANLLLKGVRSRDSTDNLALDGVVKAGLAGSRLAIDASMTGASSGEHANLTLSLPVQASAAPFQFALQHSQPMSGRFSADGELAPIWMLIYGGDQTLGGALNAQADIGGTITDPRVTGHAALANGHFEDAASGIKLRNVQAQVDMRDNVIAVQSFTAADAKAGTLTGDGRVSLIKGGSSSLTVNVRGFQLLDNEQAKATATGAVTVTRAANGQAALSGALTIDRADISAATKTPPGVVTIDVIERNRPQSQTQSQAADIAHAPSVALDIKLTAPRRVFVKGLGLDAELSLDAQVTGTTAAPILSGSAHVVRGDYDFAGKRFQIDDRGVVYLATSPNRIRLDLTATNYDPALTAIITIKGTAAKPEITLSSTPILPSDEILSQILFGTSAAQLSPVEAAQLAAAVTSLATGGGFDVMGGLRNFARLDRLALGADQASGVTVSGGKYIGEHIYLELTGGGRYGPSAQVELRPTRSLSLTSQIGGLEGTQLSVRWRHDYGGPATKAK